MPTIGLFGTCGSSRWRDKFIEKYEELGYKYFNPQVEDWKLEDAEIEAKHLVEDEIILFPVTGETHGFGSLAETGFSIMQAIKTNANRFIVVYIDPKLDANIDPADPRSKDSIRTRALVRAHLKKNSHPNVFVVKDLETMLQLSTDLYLIQGALDHAHAFCEATNV